MIARTGQRLLAVLLALSLLAGLMAPVCPPEAWAATEPSQETAIYDYLAAKAVQFNYRAFVTGETLDAYDAYVLTRAGADTTTWRTQERSLSDTVLESVHRTLAAPDSTPAKHIAYQLLAVDQWQHADLAQQLAAILAARHGENGFDGNIYSDLPAYDVFARLNGLSVIDATYARNYLLANQCTVAGAAYGAWGTAAFSDFFPDFMSTAQAVRVLASLPGAADDPEVQSAIARGLNWMQAQQRENGSVYYIGEFWADDALIDTVETIHTLKALNIAPSSWKSSADKTPVDYVREAALNPDGSFGDYGTVMGATWALSVYLDPFGAVIAPETPLYLQLFPAAAAISIGQDYQFAARLLLFDTAMPDVTATAHWSVSDGAVATVAGGRAKALQAGQTTVRATYGELEGTAALTVTAPGAPGAGQTAQILVGVAVVGRNGELLFGPAYLLVDRNGPWGQTALGALAATGLAYQTSTQWWGYVTCIAGQCARGMDGWMFKVNGVPPTVGAADKALRDGDRVIWWYSTDWTSPGPDWNELMSPAQQPQKPQETQVLELPDSLNPSTAATEALTRLAELLGIPVEGIPLGPAADAVRAVVVLEGYKPPSWQDWQQWKQKLATAQTDLAGEVKADAGGVLAGADNIVGLVIPAHALAQDVTITIQSISQNGVRPPVPAGYRPVSAFYTLGPTGTVFSRPATLVLRLAVPPTVKPENLLLARYDHQRDDWTALPAVYDPGQGLLAAKVGHFSTFAVLGRESRATFADVGPEYWARDPVELLAGAGLVRGVGDNRFAPDRPVTRAELTCLLVRVLEFEEAAGSVFRDVPAGAWYAGAVKAAAEAGLVRGFADGAFRPGAPVTRQELAAMLVRAFALDDTQPAPLNFTDAAAVAQWARNSVAAAAAAGLVSGYPDGGFRPGGQATRAETAAILYRALP